MIEEKKGFFSRLVMGLEKTRKTAVYGLDDPFNGPGEVDDSFYDELEEILVTGGVGVRVTEEILEEPRAATEERHVRVRGVCRDLLTESIKSRVDLDKNACDFEKTPSVLLLVGVNGVGKVTTVGKMAMQAKADGRRALPTGADTFHMVVIEQLEVWSQHAGAEMVRATAGASPAAVAFDACQASCTWRTDFLICDTAGRLHNRKSLMEELQKIDRVVQRELPEYRREILLVLDGTTGRNTIEQAKEFGGICDISDVVLIKLDGPIKGGVVIVIQVELKLPVKYVGVDEKIDDLRKFDAGRHAEALFAKEPNRESKEEV